PPVTPERAAPSRPAALPIGRPPAVDPAAPLRGPGNPHPGGSGGRGPLADRGLLRGRPGTGPGRAGGGVGGCPRGRPGHAEGLGPDRKSTRLNSSHVKISYAV